MLYKFFNKKGNITVILIGLISVMLLMTLALSRRMTSHTQLLTLGDYTQISRYFLESYVSHVLQKVKEQVNDPTSGLSKAICKSIDENFTGEDITSEFDYSEKSDELEALTTIYGSNNKITRIEPIIKLTGLTEKLGYPDWLNMTDPAKSGVEKKGYLEITCACKFNKREYTLVVQFPFIVVYRMTPVIKDFMLFVGDIYQEQRWSPTQNVNGGVSDKLNLLTVKDGFVEEKIDDYFKNDSRLYRSIRPESKFRPMILTADTNLIDEKESGMVYLGPTDKSFRKSIFLNLAGISPESSNSALDSHNFDNGEIHLISPQSIGLPDDYDISTPVTFPLGTVTSRAYGTEIDLNKASGGTGLAKIGLFGFCNELYDFFKNSSIYPITDFLNDDLGILMESGKETYWGEIVQKGWEHNMQNYLRFTSGVKLFGLHFKNSDNEAPVIPRRQIFGNVFGRFILFSFWTIEFGVALKYNLEKAVGEMGVTEEEGKFLKNYDDTSRIIKFIPPGYQEGVTGIAEQKEIYKTYMSKIMSGMVAKNNFRKDGRGANQNLFLPMNYDYSGGHVHSVFDESDFKPKDGFEIDYNSNTGFTFDKFGDSWFGVSENQNNSNRQTEPSPIEKRIGRAYNSAKDFKEAVGYPNKFKINGVVYVKPKEDGEENGVLDLSEKDMNLSPEDCSGGIVLVDGNIKLGNIFRGEEFNPTKFEYYSGSFSGLQKYESWKNASDSLYIGPDKIITFVCLKGKNNESRSINISGNVLLGVQLVNFSSPDSSGQISWATVDKNQEILFYGSIACNKLDLFNKLIEFGAIKKPTIDKELNGPFFIYPPVMASSNPPLAVQVMDDMRSYKLTSGAVSE